MQVAQVRVRGELHAAGRAPSRSGGVAELLGRSGGVAKLLGVTGLHFISPAPSRGRAGRRFADVNEQLTHMAACQHN